jgi:steroid delta-isomerase-like uncharacterized protein
MVHQLRFLLAGAAVLTFAFGCAADPEGTLERNKALVRRAFEEVWNQGDLDAVDQLFSADFVRHFPIGSGTRGLAAFRARAQDHRSAFPDWSEQIELMVAEGDLVAVYFSSAGTNVGSFLGNPPTGQQINITEMTIFRIADDKIAEQWLIPDLVSLNRQLGLIPE